MQTENSGIENLKQQQHKSWRRTDSWNHVVLSRRENTFRSILVEGKIKAVLHIGGRATGTIDDFIHGRQGALWMTSSMDATEEGKRSVLVLVQLEAAGSVWHMQMEKFRY